MVRCKIIGIEYDEESIRAAKILHTFKAENSISIENIGEIKGNYKDAKNLSRDVQVLLNSLGLEKNDTIVSCLKGKYVHGVQVTVEHLPEENVIAFLKRKLQKYYTFDLKRSRLDYQVIGRSSSKKSVDLMTAAVYGEKIQNHLNLFQGLSVQTKIVDILPLVVANTYWIGKSTPKNDAAVMMVHVGLNESTVVIESNEKPFYYRRFKLAYKLCLSEDVSKVNLEKGGDQICKELLNTITHYQKVYASLKIESFTLLGYAINNEIKEKIKNRTGLKLIKVNLLKRYGSGHKIEDGKYDVAITLGLRDRRIKRELVKNEEIGFELD